MGRTTISCSEGPRDRLAEHKPDDMSWDEFLDAVAAVFDEVPFEGATENPDAVKQAFPTAGDGGGDGVTSLLAEIQELTATVEGLESQLDEIAAGAGGDGSESGDGVSDAELEAMRIAVREEVRDVLSGMR